MIKAGRKVHINVTINFTICNSATNSFAANRNFRTIDKICQAVKESNLKNGKTRGQRIFDWALAPMIFTMNRIIFRRGVGLPSATGKRQYRTLVTL